MRQALNKTLRSELESAVINARDIAEQAAREAIERLGVGEAVAPSYLDKSEAKLRVKLRAHGRSLGDNKAKNGEQGIEKLVSEAAYEHWHRMLFARFLEQNNLLMYDANTSLTLEECEELAADESARNGWEYAGQLAAKMLPQVFRNDSPVFGLSLALNHVRALEALISQLDLNTFQAQDSLGWVYQFWQTKRKQQVNDSGVKIGADEISPVTQLFTEPYMVSFLLDNALGAWWAKRVLTRNDLSTASSEQDLRERAALDGVPLQYLRFVKAESGQWEPAGGDFEQWPQHLSELKTMDPCCGSGHFLVAAFLMLVPIRMQLEELDAKDAIDKVIQQNLHGLELDQRCVELAAFALALEAWRFPKSDGKPIGYRQLPEIQLACSGLSVQAAKAEWKALGVKLQDESGKKNIAIALDWLHQTFCDAPILGSLINPKRAEAADIVEWDTLSDALEQALATDSDDIHSAQIAAKGMTMAAELLAGQYNWVITNVPYLARGKQDEVLRNFCEQHYPVAKNDLATVFLDRCLELCVEGGTASVVLPQNWLFLTSYKQFRERMLKVNDWHLLARLGPGAFDTISGEVVKAVLLSISRGQASHNSALLDQSSDDGVLRGVDVAELKTAEGKAAQLVVNEVKTVGQAAQLNNPDFRVSFEKQKQGEHIAEVSECYQGLVTGDIERFTSKLWEIKLPNIDWAPFRRSNNTKASFGDVSELIFWQAGNGQLSEYAAASRTQLHDMHESGNRAWGKVGVAINRMGKLAAVPYFGEHFDNNVAVVFPKNYSTLVPLYCFIDSKEFRSAVRSLDQAIKVTNRTLLKVPFNLEHWSEAANEQYPNGLPEPHSNDPTQWVFHGHPCCSVIWHAQHKTTAVDVLRRDHTILQVAVARLLGYRWPAELDIEMKLAPEQWQCVEACEPLLALIDDDGIVCLPAIRGELGAADRLVHMLEAAYGGDWDLSVQAELLDSVGAKSLDAWLRDKFFAQHCKLFGNRPFIWQIWDGLKDGFSALVNYHQFDHDNLDRLIYTYLGDWIRTQEHGVKNNVDGADIRLAAAENLKHELEAIKEGETSADGSSGYDIFVRWKPLEQQPIGWQPDLNDGVRLNIRPFMTAADMGKKGAGVLRAKPSIHWKKDRGNDVPSAPWYTLGEKYGEKVGARINDHHLTLAEKKAARESAAMATEKGQDDDVTVGKLL